MFCSISGALCADPVVAVPNGLVYERSTIESLVDRGAACPLSGISLTPKDLVSIKSPENRAVPLVVPASASTSASASIPTLLRSLQSAYDNLILDCHALKVERGMLQSQLSTALYQHDAACRVVARLIREKAALAAEHEELKTRFVMNDNLQLPASTKSNNTTLSTTTINPSAAESQSKQPSASSHAFTPASPLRNADAAAAFKNELTELSNTLSSTRKMRRGPHMPTPDIVAAFEPSYTLEGQYSGVALMRAVTPSHAETTHIVLAGKTRGSTLYAMPAFTSVASWPLKSVKVSHLEVLAHSRDDPRFVAARKDVVVVVSKSDVVSSVPIPLDAPGGVLSLTAHPGGKHYAMLLAAETAPVLRLVAAASGDTLYSLTLASASPDAAAEVLFHPDGILMAVANGPSIVMHDCTTGAELTQLTSTSTTSTDTLELFAFSENGFHLATVGGDKANAVVSIWDLRKLQIAFTLPVAADSRAAAVTVTALAFDYTGALLCVAYEEDSGSRSSSKAAVFQYTNKKWGRVSGAALVLPVTLAPVASVAWGANSRSIIFASGAHKHLCVVAHDASLGAAHELPPSRVALRAHD